MEAELIFLFCIVLLAYFTQAMTGFGSLIIAITLGSHFYPISFLLPVAIPLDIILNTFVVRRSKKMIQWSILIRGILPSMSIGLLIGLLLFELNKGAAFKVVFGALIAAISAFQLYEMLGKKRAIPALSSRVRRGFYFSAGIVQGLFGSGGPFVVYAVSRSGLNKSSFRATLALLWLTVNSTLFLSYAVTSKLSESTSYHSLILSPTMLVGILLGEWAHRKINEHYFRILIYSILLVSGISIVLSFVFRSSSI